MTVGHWRLCYRYQQTEDGDEGLYHTIPSSHELMLSEFTPWLCDKMDPSNIAGKFSH